MDAARLEEIDLDPRAFVQTLNALVACRSSREFSKVFNRELARYLDFDVAGLYLYSACAESFTCISAEHLDPGTPGYEISQLPTEGSMKQSAVLAQRALLCDNLIGSSWSEGVALGKWRKASSCIIAPLMVPSKDEQSAERTIGVIFLGVHRHGALKERDRILLEGIGRRVAPSLQAVLAIEERNVFLAIDRRAVAGSVTMETLFPSVTDIIQQVIPNNGSALIALHRHGVDLRLETISTEGLSLDLDQFNHLLYLLYETSAFSEAMTTKHPLLLTGHNRCASPEIPYLESLGLLSSLLTPLYARDMPFGFLLIGSHRRNAFSERDVALCDYLGHHLSQAISNLQAFVEIQALKDQIEMENRYLREEIKGQDHGDPLLGESPVFLKTLNMIDRIAPTDSTVLIMGETGTGKELVAQTLYKSSPRRNQPFIRVNCATLPESLIEAELFGHERGAFTHAEARKIGRFELANEGTLFLDEVGELPIGLQAKLLRAIESQEFERLGGVKTIKVDVRILAATNVDLETAVKFGRFRADLYYRLKVLPMTVPPLRERREDIALLADHFLNRHAARYRKKINRIHPKTLQTLSAYDWPGNVRELHHMIERAVILAQGPELIVEDLGDQPGNRSALQFADADRLDVVERDHILKVLDQCRWVVSGPKGAAKRLGLHRATLQYRIKKLGIRKKAT
ncbi:MAG: sigma-54 interaction domain-containing protein [Nitrospiria bacterium]